MPRKTKRTIRKLTPLARDLVRLGNDLDKLARRAHTLALKVQDREIDSEHLQSFLTKIEGAGS